MEWVKRRRPVRVQCQGPPPWLAVACHLARRGRVALPWVTLDLRCAGAGRADQLGATVDGAGRNLQCCIRTFGRLGQVLDTRQGWSGWRRICCGSVWMRSSPTPGLPAPWLGPCNEWVWCGGLVDGEVGAGVGGFSGVEVLAEWSERAGAAWCW